MFKLFRLPALYFFFFFNDTATTEIYTLSLHDALPICGHEGRYRQRRQRHQRVEAGLQQDASGSHHDRSEEHTSELQSRPHLVCRLLLEKKKKLFDEMQAICESYLSSRLKLHHPIDSTY